MRISRSDQLILLLLVLGTLIMAGFKANQENVVEAIIREPQRVDINTATLRELQMLPRIGPRLAQRIIEYRQRYGDFRSIEEIVEVKGIGKKTFAILSNLITVKKEERLDADLQDKRR